MTDRNNGTETIEPKTYPASLAQASGSWLQSNGAGEFIALTATNRVAGLLLEDIASTDPNFASEKLVMVDLVTESTDRFLMDVLSTITAGAFVVGQTYTILTVGTTDFTLIGASANTIGVSFVATGAGTGTGTATTAGLATTEMEGLTFDVGTNPGSLNVGTAGTQFQITRFISQSQVEVRVNLIQSA